MAPVDMLDDPLAIDTDPLGDVLLFASLEPNVAPDTPSTVTLPSATSPVPDTREIEPPTVPDPAFNTTDPAVEPLLDP